MKAIKCSNCGANIVANIKKSNYTCPYCGTTYELETEKQVETKVVDETKIQNLETNTNKMTTDKSQRNFPLERPVLHTWLAILGLFFYIWPGLLYIIIVRALQDKWDREHDNDTK